MQKGSILQNKKSILLFKQKELGLELKLKVMQLSTDKQLDDKVAGKIDQTILSSKALPAKWNPPKTA